MSILRNSVRLSVVLKSLAITILLAVPLSTHAATAVFTITTGSPAEFSGNIQVGSLFQVVNTITASSVGAYVPVTGSFQSGGETTVDFTGLLYGVSGSSTSAGSYTLIEKVLIPSGTAVDSNGFAYASFASPHILTTGNQYAVTAWVGIPTVASVANYNWTENSLASASTNANVLRISTQYINTGTAIGAPTSSNPNKTDFGGNLLFSTPEPASLTLLASASFMVLGRRRRTA